MMNVIIILKQDHIRLLIYFNVLVLVHGGGTLTIPVPVAYT